MDSDDGPTVWCGNLPTNITEELLYELFLQAAPLKKVRIPTDGKTGKPAQYGFITFKHEVSVDYAVRLLDGTKLHDRFIRVKPRNPSNAQQSELPAKFGNQNERFKNYCVEDKPRSFTRFEDKKFRHGENRHNNYNRHDNHNGHGKYNNRGGGHNRYDPIEYNNYGNNRRRRF